MMDEMNDPVINKNTQEIDRTQLKEERRLRNKQKKLVKKLEKQREREQKELILKLQPKSKNVTLITRAFADKVVGNTSTVGVFNYNTTVISEDFPALGAKCKSSIVRTEDSTINTVDAVINVVECELTNNAKKKPQKLELADFLCGSSTVAKQTQTQVTTQTIQNYSGNLLDSDLPLRKKGKFREVPKIKRPSKLKHDVIIDNDKAIDESNDTALLLTETILCDNMITEELDALTQTFISMIVSLQEKLYKRDPKKGTSKRRYVVGFHEVKKYLNLNKVKILIIATDIKLIKYDGDSGLDGAIKQIVDLAKNYSVPYLFALKRRFLGILTLKYIPVSCIAVLNYEGVEDHFSNIMKLLPQLKECKTKTVVDTIESETNMRFLNNLMAAL